MTTTRFDRSLLPLAKPFYERELGKLTREDRKGWAKGNCPFHQSQSKKSFSVHLASGGFYCHGCGACGGDVVAFTMKRDGVPFKRACERLGAWRDDGLPTVELRRIEREKRARLARQREMAAKALDCKNKRLAARDCLHALEFQHREVAQKLNAAPEGSELAEQCWDLLARLTEQIRDQEALYLQLADLEPKPIERGA